MNPSTSNIEPLIKRIQQPAMLVGGLGVLACAVGVGLDRGQFMRSYLTAYLFWLNIAAGCLPLLFIHYLAGGRWSYSIRRFLEAGIRTLPLLALLFLPLLMDLPSLYIWARPEVVENDLILQHKEPYLNVTFWVVRAATYFVIWMFLGRLALTWGAESEAKRNIALARPLRGLGAIGLGLFALTTTFASIDWVMALDPHWFSTVFGMHYGVGQMMAALSLCIICVALLRGRDESLAKAVQTQQTNDHGNFLLAFVMFWAYLAFSQFLIIWSGNIREEVPWYLHRLDAGWQTMSIALLVLHFAVPFLFLLSPKLKQNPRQLARLAAWMLAMRFVDLYWHVAPTFSEHGIHVHWLDAATFAAVGGIWVWAYFKVVGRHSLVSPFDPRLEHIKEVDRQHHG
jgi:hypothetical protein